MFYHRSHTHQCEVFNIFLYNFPLAGIYSEFPRCIYLHQPTPPALHNMIEVFKYAPPPSSLHSTPKHCSYLDIIWTFESSNCRIQSLIVMLSALTENKYGIRDAASDYGKFHKFWQIAEKSWGGGGCRMLNQGGGGGVGCCFVVKIVALWAGKNGLIQLCYDNIEVWRTNFYIIVT